MNQQEILMEAEEIIELFQELAHQEDKCVIVVTHSQEVAKQSDRAVYLSKKKLEIKEMNNPTKEKLKNINCNPIIK